jgi:hypothetical protein
LEDIEKLFNMYDTIRKWFQDGAKHSKDFDKNLSKFIKGIRGMENW